MLLIVVLAVVVAIVLVGGVLVGLLLINRDEPAATPSPSLSVIGPSPADPTAADPSAAGPSSSSPAPDPSSSPPAPPADPSRMDLGTTITFPNFSVTVTKVVANEAQGVMAHAEVCVRKLPDGTSGDNTRVSWDPWRVVTADQTYKANLYDGSHPPADMFPYETQLEVGECASGWITFSDVADRDDVRRVTYANSLGDTAGWLVSG